MALIASLRLARASYSLFPGLPAIVTSHCPIITTDMFFLAAKHLSQPVLPALQIPSSAPIRPQAPPQQRRPPQPAATSSESSSESEEEDSDDDAPLATLVAPRRPGSALSSFSGSNPNLVGSHTNLAASTNLPPSPLPPHHPGHKHSGSQSGSSIASSSPRGRISPSRSSTSRSSPLRGRRRSRRRTAGKMTDLRVEGCSLLLWARRRARTSWRRRRRIRC
ncbi:hypothetical protein K438DRAFT_871133 [Mycena galopus ATCC 62051]|nr:hypothetical protein K438DRAFT_871133 [Mycena galopus ATCC 62051]